MASTKISGLSAASALGVADLLPIVASGNTQKLTGQQLRDFASLLPANARTASFVFAVTDVGDTVTVTAASAVSATIPLNSVTPLPIGALLTVIQLGAGAVTFVAGDPAVTLNKKSSLGLASNGQFSVISAYQYAANTWLITGDVVAA